MIALARARRATGTCPACRTADSALWGDQGLVACAACWSRRVPGQVVRFAVDRPGPPRAIVQDVLPGFGA